MDLLSNQSRVTRLYYNAQAHNRTNQSVQAKYSATLSKPLISDPNNGWNLAINRFRIPLAGIPLTPDNIPFEQWQVSLGYHSGASTTYKSAYVPQYNPKTVTGQNQYCVNANSFIETTSSINPYTIVSSNALSYGSVVVNPVCETTNNVVTTYATNAVQDTVYAYQNGSGTIIYTFATPTVPIDQAFAGITAICTDASGNFYIAYTGYQSSTSNLLPYIQSYTRVDAITWTLSTNYNYPAFAGINVHFTTIFAFGGQVLAYMTDNPTSIYVIWDIGTSVSVSSGSVAASQTISITNGTYAIRCDNSGSLTVCVSLSAYLYIYSGIYVGSFLGFDASGYLLIYRVDSGGSPIGYQAIDVTTGGVVYSFAPPNGCLSIGFAEPYSYSVDSGPYDLWTYQDYLTKINLALSDAFTAIKTAIGVTYLPTNAPRIVFDSTNKLFTLVCDTDYTDNVTYLIDLNAALQAMFVFPAIADSGLSGFSQIVIQNNGYNAGGSTTLNIFQEASTLYAFNDIATVLVQTSRIPVNGDCEGDNNSVLILTDVCPDTTSLSPNEPLIYVPNGILRWYSLYQSHPLINIDIYFSYKTKSGMVYPIMVPPSDWFSCKLEFKSGN